MWQRFTEHARKIMFYAQEEAQNLGQGYVSTEHLLLGVTRDRHTVAMKVLDLLGVGVERIRTEVEQRWVASANPSREMILTPRAKRTINFAVDEARNLNDRDIGSEHLLLGLLREPDSIAAIALIALGIDLERARAALQSVRTGEPLPSARDDPAAAFLLGDCIQEHLMLNLIAGDEKSAKIVRSQVEDVAALQWRLWQSILECSQEGTKGIEPPKVSMLLEMAQAEANGGRLRPYHFLLALMSAHWAGSSLAVILERAGMKLEVTRELAAEL